MNLYQENILDHYRNPRHRGAVANAAKAEIKNPLCGDRLTIYLQDGRTVQIAFDGEGCAISQAAASMLAEELSGKTLAEVKDFRDEDMLELIGVPLGPARLKCGLLAVSGLRQALLSLK